MPIPKTTPPTRTATHRIKKTRWSKGSRRSFPPEVCRGSNRRGERLRELMRELFEIIHLHDGCDASVFTALLQAKKSLILTAATTNVPIVPPAQQLLPPAQQLLPPAQQPSREAQNLAKRFVTPGESLSPVLRPNNLDLHHESGN